MTDDDTCPWCTFAVDVDACICVDGCGWPGCAFDLIGFLVGISSVVADYPTIDFGDTDTDDGV